MIWEGTIGAAWTNADGAGVWMMDAAAGVGPPWAVAEGGGWKMGAGLTRPEASAVGVCSAGVKGGWADGALVALEGSTGGEGGGSGSSPWRRLLRRFSAAGGVKRPGVFMGGRGRAQVKGTEEGRLSD